MVSLLLLAVFAVSAPAQDPPPDTHTLRVDVRLVNVDVAVTDADGEFVDDLARENFRLFEDGVPQALIHFAPTTAPVRVVLLVEVSPAVYLIHRDHLLAAYELVRALRPEDEVALVSYARTARREVPFARDKTEIERGLDSLGRFGLGMAEMNLLDAVSETLEWLSPTPRRTAVLVIATGLDSGSATAWPELEQRLGASQVTVFTLATGFLLRGQPPSDKKGRPRNEAADDLEAMFVGADSRLRALAEASAGEAYFPTSAEELGHIYREIGIRLRNLYSLGYYPTNNARGGSYREISIELVGRNGERLGRSGAQDPGDPYRVFARPGYFARAEQ